MSARKWSKEQREAMSANRKAAWAEMRAQQAAAKIAKEQPASPVGRSIAAPKIEMDMHSGTGMGVPHVVTPTAGTVMPQVEPPKSRPLNTGEQIVELPDGRKFNNADPSPADVPPPNLYSGRVKNLEVHPNYQKYPDATPNDPIPGYRLYWHHDVGSEIEKAFRTGYRLVEKDEIGLNDAQVGPGNNDLGTHVRKCVNPREQTNVQIYAFLMKKPNWLADLHDAEAEKVHQMQEDQLNAGNINNEVPANVRHTPSVGISTRTTSLYKSR